MNASAPPEGHRFIRRHSGVVRMTHWINVLCMAVLLMSGLQIFNAHPALYWGEISTFDDPLLAMRAYRAADGRPIGVTEVFDAEFDTTGVLGLSTVNGRLAARGFPYWITLPSYQDLATGRRWHFFFAWLFVINGLVYVGWTLAAGHWRDLAPTRAQLRSIGSTIREHLTLRFPKGEEARRYNVLQKLAYLGVIVVLVPVLILSGLTMSPGMNAEFPWLTDLFGGRQSARTVHFVVAALLLLFVFVHVLMVVLSGAFNNLRAMITGKYRINAEEPGHAAE
jgi:thiosulfate reductase cytochrome b subunit